jgi:hypothetical protein
MDCHFALSIMGCHVHGISGPNITLAKNFIGCAPFNLRLLRCVVLTRRGRLEGATLRDETKSFTVTTTS